MQQQDAGMRGKILVVYYHYRGYPLRATTKDWLYSFERYSGCLCYYANLAFGFPTYLKDIEFDLIVFTDMFLSKRNLLRFFDKAVEYCQPLKGVSAKKIAVPQDEFYYTDVLNHFINAFGVEHIFSVAPESEWGKIYPLVDRDKVKIDFVLTGYLDDEIVKFYDGLSRENISRDIDIGYRSTPLRYSLGRFGYLKGRIAEVFNEHAPQFDLKTDISTQPKDTKLGLDWYRFLASCKYFIGVESGASLLDPDGSIYHNVNAYLEQNPDADFDEVEQNCFKGLDENLHLYALGPRHLEACAARTCQILVEGHYGGLLKPGTHYIPLKKDFSNIDEVLRIVKDDKLRSGIVESAYQDVVASRKWTYREFVKFILDKSFSQGTLFSEITANEHRLYDKNKRREAWIWRYIPIQSRFITLVEMVFPKNIMRKIIKFVELSRK
jgi:hypothetical protein